MLSEKSIIQNNYITFYKSSQIIQHYYPKYANYLDKNYKNILLYEPVNSEFIVRYIDLYPLNCSKIQLYTSSSDWLEAVLYSTINYTNLEVIQSLLDNMLQTSKLQFNSEIDKLKERYDGLKFNETIITTYTTDNIQKFSNNNIDLFIYSNDKSNTDELYFYSVLALNSLNKSGSYYFKWVYYSSDYMINLLSILKSYFKQIKIEENIIDYSYIIKCIDFIGISNDQINHLSNQLNNPLKITPDEKISNLVKKYSNKIIRENELLLDGIIPMYGKLLSDITDDDLILLYNNNKEMYLNNCIALCVRYQIPLKPEYIDNIINFNDKLFNSIITMQRPLIIELVDYNKYCNIPLSMIRNVYHTINKTSEQKIPYKNPIRPIQRNVALVTDNNPDCTPIILDPKNYNYNNYTYLVSDNINKLKKQLNIYKFNIDVIGEKEWSLVNHSINIQSYIVYYHGV